jgi:hypothetical protein
VRSSRRPVALGDALRRDSGRGPVRSRFAPAVTIRSPAARPPTTRTESSSSPSVVISTGVTVPFASTRQTRGRPSVDCSADSGSTKDSVLGRSACTTVVMPSATPSRSPPSVMRAA